jgi:hypothetical protein
MQNVLPQNKLFQRTKEERKDGQVEVAHGEKSLRRGLTWDVITKGLYNMTMRIDCFISYYDKSKLR